MASRILPLRFTQHLQKVFTGKKLLLTNTVATCTLLGVADALQQGISGDFDPNQNKSFDDARTRRFAIMGLIMGPMSHFWYQWLEKTVVRGAKAAIVSKKILLDVAVAPAFGSTFVSAGMTISGLALLEGDSVLGAISEYQRKFYRIFRLDVCVWPPTQVFNFWFLPLRFRVIYVNCVQLFYNCCLSYIKHNEADGTKTSVRQVGMNRS